MFYPLNLLTNKAIALLAAPLSFHTASIVSLFKIFTSFKLSHPTLTGKSPSANKNRCANYEIFSI